MDTPLRQIRKKNGLTLRSVAKAVGISVSQLSRLEHGRHQATADQAEKLCRFYRGKITELQVLYPRRFMSRRRRAA